jgi:predicted acetyltransferase
MAEMSRDDRPGEVVLEPATQSDAAVLSNLLELYSHDLSDVFVLEPGADGRFGYGKLPLYWSEPENRFPFLIRAGTRLAGFALVTRGSPESDDPNAFDIAEFFVLRRHRHSGVGRRAAFLLCVIAEYTSSTPVETTRPGSPHAWRVFSFNSANKRMCS